ncbi:hypothetical protein [Haliangium sp.]|uniref:hypothetical protein n=1 Tax=Haliangium sp. TaxID=2663208 RepID=UPI003D13D502
MKTDKSPVTDVRPFTRIVFGVFLMFLALFLMASIVFLWNGFDFSKWGAPIDSDVEFIALALVTGAFGSYIHVATSFTTFVGTQRLRKSWLWWYLLRPFIGASLALITYFLIRGGLLMPTVSGGGEQVDATQALSPFGVGALSALVGMFSKQAADKLREVFDNMFRTTDGMGDDARGDKLPGADPDADPDADPEGAAVAAGAHPVPGH